MAFFGRVGNVLKQTASKQISSNLSLSNPSIFQAIRCMSSKVFIGGLSYNTDETSLREAFSKYGEVVDARIIMDRESGRSRGFGFITYASSEEASTAIQALDAQELHGRRVRVNYATDRAPRSFGGGGYGGQGGYGGGDGSYNPSYGQGGGYEGNQGYGGGGSNYNAAPAYGSGGDGSYNAAPGYGSGGDGNYNAAPGYGSGGGDGNYNAAPVYGSGGDGNSNTAPVYGSGESNYNSVPGYGSGGSNPAPGGSNFNFSGAGQPAGYGNSGNVDGFAATESGGNVGNSGSNLGDMGSENSFDDDLKDGQEPDGYADRRG